MNNSQLINQDSGDTEYYTPIEIVNAAREVMGSIDLDPASSERANERVKANAFHDGISTDGLAAEWHGNIWMNHPFSRQGNKLWIEKLIYEWTDNRAKQACCITFAATSERWFAPLHYFPQCYLSPRTNYYLADGSVKRGVTKGSVVTYLGYNTDGFIKEFGSFGHVKLPPRWEQIAENKS